MSEEPAKWQKLDSKIVFQHPRITLVEDEVRLPNGKITTYLRQPYKGNGGVTVICIQDNKILIQREYSYPVDEVLWQFPGGKIEVGEGHLGAASRELVEESSLTLIEPQYAGCFYIDNRRTNAKMHVVFGKAGKSSQVTDSSDEEEFIHNSWIGLDDFAKMIAEGEIRNYAILAAWALFVAKTRIANS